jgi:hypothetical protein
MSLKAKNDFIFKKHMSIGDVDAENDGKFLRECFIDNGDFDVIEDTESPQSIIVGRTGVGKSALVEQLLYSANNVISIEPEELALKHISNSSILQFFEDLGVNLDVFYNLLWQHTFAVELIKFKYSITNIAESKSFLTQISQLIIGDKKKKQALNYLEEWGDKFWVSTELRIKEFTEKVESSLSAGLKAKWNSLDFSLGAKNNLTEEQRSELIHYGKTVVNDTQIQKLSKIINLLSEDVFNDPQNKVYIVIDRLDENWVDDELRYKLIRALIETIKKFRKIEPVKIVITLRTDLLDRVLEKTRDSGFQLEKYRNLFLKVGWNRAQLQQLLDKRINFLLKHKYTNSEVCFSDIFPNTIEKITSIDYVLDRTLLRPRDSISFVNTCLTEAQGKSEITGSTIKNAEQDYSKERRESLEYEWFVEHSQLSTYIDILHDKRKSFKVSEIDSDILEVLILQLSGLSLLYEDNIIQNAKQYMKSDYPLTVTIMTKFKKNLLFSLYKVGAIGIKINGKSSVKWIHDKTQDLTPQKIDDTSVIYIHKILWRNLAVDSR